MAEPFSPPGIQPGGQPGQPGQRGKPGQPGQPLVAVFNFQLTTPDAGYTWLEKFLSDQITTDLSISEAADVVARDEMQLLASQMNWVPELAADARAMGQVRAKLRIEFLVSGRCSVADGKLEIIGQIIDVSTRQELARRTVSGKLAEALELQKRLSAEIVAWFVKKPPADILPTLPVWTKSIPAVQALYEGMDLYDHGRYADAWLKFRSASAADNEYAEAGYWVGKMYYFMDRYEHARRSFEKFVYISQAHPRIGDAIKEYLDTFEKLDAEPETLLKLYDTFRRRWPEVIIYDPYFIVDRGKGPCGEWLKQRSARVLQSIGRHDEAAAISGPAFVSLDAPSKATCVDNILLHRRLTGRNVPDDVLLAKGDDVTANEVSLFRQIVDSKIVNEMTMEVNGSCGRPVLLCRFGLGEKELLCRPRVPKQLAGRAICVKQGGSRQTVVVDNNGRIVAGKPLIVNGVRWQNLLIAPDGKVFKRLTFYPKASGKDARLIVMLHPLYSNTLVAAEALSAVLPDTAAGLSPRDLPPEGMFIADFYFMALDAEAGPAEDIEGVRVVAEMADVPAKPGAVDVACLTTPQFHVDIDGRPGRYNDGVFGPLAPGRHVITFKPNNSAGGFCSAETAVDVPAGKTVRVAVALPTEPGGKLAGWQTTRVATTYPGHDLVGEELPLNRPIVLVEPNLTRLVWCYRRDIWTSETGDGRRWSPPRKLALPISSAWSEHGIRCIRGENGQYVMMLRSDRDGQHRDLCYVTWSRDFVHWSAPAVIETKTTSVGYQYDLVQDRGGRFLLFTNVGYVKMIDGHNAAPWFGINVLASDDAVTWRDLGRVLTVPRPIWRIDGLHARISESGGYELFAMASRNIGNAYSHEQIPDAVQFFTLRSSDLKNWQVDSTTAKVEYGANGFDVIRSEKRTVVAMFLASRPGMAAGGGLRIMWREGDGAWMLSPQHVEPAYPSAAFAWSQHTGWLLASMPPTPGAGRIKPAAGPFVMTGPSIDSLLAGAKPLVPIDPKELVAKPKIVVPPEADAPLDQSRPGPCMGADTPKDWLIAVEGAAAKAEKSHDFRFICVHGDPRYREQFEKECQLRHELMWRARRIMAFAPANLPTTLANMLRMTMSGSTAWQEVALPLKPVTVAGTVDWSRVEIVENGDKATVTIAGRPPLPLVKVDGKWYASSGYEDPERQAEMARNFRGWPVMLKGLETLEQRLREGKVSASTYDLEIDRIMRSVAQAEQEPETHGPSQPK